jgi:hypothetical protein
MLTLTIKDRDKGLRKINKSFKGKKKHKIKVGLFGYQAGIGAIHEFGAPANRIPARPFISTTIDKNRKKYEKLFERYSKHIVTGRIELETVLQIIAITVASDIKKTITNLKKPKNAPSTIKKKGFDNPLIETGLMRNAVEAQPE